MPLYNSFKQSAAGKGHIVAVSEADSDIRAIKNERRIC